MHRAAYFRVLRFPFNLGSVPTATAKNSFRSLGPVDELGVGFTSGGMSGARHVPSQARSTRSNLP